VFCIRTFVGRYGWGGQSMEQTCRSGKAPWGPGNGKCPVAGKSVGRHGEVVLEIGIMSWDLQ
jgi:hypothetical protein